MLDFIFMSWVGFFGVRILVLVMHGVEELAGRFIESHMAKGRWMRVPVKWELVWVPDTK